MLPSRRKGLAVPLSADPRFFEQLFHAAPDAVIVVDRGGIIRMANAQAQGLFGWDPQELVGRPVEVLLPASLKHRHVEHRAGYLDDPVARPMAAGVDLTAVRADGTEVPVDISLSPLRAGDERFVAAAIRDATERRAFERRLAESEHRLRTSLERMLDGFATFRPVREDGRIVDFEWTSINTVGALTHGRPAEELVGARMRDVVAGIEDHPMFAAYVSVAETGIPWTGTRLEYDDVGASGTFDIRAWQLDDGFAVTWRDVTDTARADRELRRSEERFRTSVEDLHEALAVLTAVRDDTGTVVDVRCEYANAFAAGIAGLAGDDLIGRTLEEVLPVGEADAALAVCREVVERGRPWTAPTLWTGDGLAGAPRRAFDVRLTRLHDGLVVVAREVTAERRHEEHLELQREALERTNAEILRLNELGALLAGCVDIDEAYAVGARAAAGLLPGHPGVLSAVGRDDGPLEPVASWGDVPAGLPVFGPQDCWALRRGQPHVSTLEAPRCRHLADSTVPRCLCVPMAGQGETIGVLHVFDVDGPTAGPAGDFEASVGPLATTIARQVALAAGNLLLRDRLHELSIRDPLTGLYNRRYMEETLRREVARANRTMRPVAVLQADLDHFKGCNDRHGHAGGDAVLRAVSAVLTRTFRASDVVCRLGGEEFTVILPECDAADALEKAEIVRSEVAALRVHHLGAVIDGLSISLGVATLPESARTAGDLLHAADAALYGAKHEGRDRVVAAPRSG